jgi:tetratricopeptide (TPR) repeat protein
VEEFPDVPEYRIRYGESLNLAGDFAAADEQFERAVRLDPRSSRIYGDAAEANRLSDRPVKAATYFEKALEVDPDNPEYSLRLGQLYLKIWSSDKEDGHLRSAEEELSKVGDSRISTEDQRAKSQLLLGRVYERWKKPDKAVAAYEQALEIAPNLERALRNLERLKRR